MKTLWLMICNIENRRPARRAKEGAKASASAKQPIEGSKTSNWKQAINQLSVAYPQQVRRILVNQPPYTNGQTPSPVAGYK